MREELEQLRADNQDLRRLVEDLKAIVTLQSQKIEALQAQLNKSSKNSHKPPSSDTPKQRSERKNKRKTKNKSGNKPGGQKGHKGSHRQMLAQQDVDHFVDCIPSTCQGCHQPLSGADDKPRIHQVWEIPPIDIQVTQYQIHRLRCDCGHKTCGSLPQGITSSQFGPRLHALHATLRLQLRCSRARTQTFMRDVLGLKISKGALSAMDRRMSQAFEPIHEQLGQVVQQAPVKFCDETTWYLDGQRQTLWSASTETCAYLRIEDKRDTASCKLLLGEEAYGYIVSDRYSAYHWVDNAQRQMCWAHVLRDFIAMSERPGGLGVTGRLLTEQAGQLLKQYAKVRGQSAQEWAKYVEHWQGQRDYIKALLSTASDEGGSGKYGGMAREIRKYEECLWTFLQDRQLEPTNNHAERTLRHAVILRKTSYGSRSQWGKDWMSRGLSLLQTMNLQSRSFYHFVLDTLLGRSPQILPT